MEAFDGDGDEDLGSGGVGGGDVVSDAVEVGDNLVDGSRRSSARWDVVSRWWGVRMDCVKDWMENYPGVKRSLKSAWRRVFP